MWLADVHRTQISKYERGETEPQAEVLAKLSRALGVSAEELFSGIGWQPTPPQLTLESDPPAEVPLRPGALTMGPGRRCRGCGLPLGSE